MAKFHISEAGNPAPCKATVNACPRGGEADHYSSPQAARQAYEAAQAAEMFAPAQQRSARVEGYTLAIAIVAFVATLKKFGREHMRVVGNPEQKVPVAIIYNRWSGEPEYASVSEGWLKAHSRHEADTAMSDALSTIALPNRPDDSTTQQAVARYREYLDLTHTAATSADPAEVRSAYQKARLYEKRGWGGASFERANPKLAEGVAAATATDRQATPQASGGHRYGSPKPLDPEFIEWLKAEYIRKFHRHPDADGVDAGALLAMFNRKELP